MKKKAFVILALLYAAVQSVWAQNGIYCTASDVGRVICTDGNIYDNVSAATAAGSHAVAKIIWVDDKNKKGLALNLWDEGYANRTDGIERCNNKNTSGPVAGAVWKLATKDEWNTMIDAAGGQRNLANGFSSVGGNNLNTSYGYYATSSVTSYAPNRKYYVYKFGSYSGWTDSKNDLACLVRPCLTFNLLTLYTINNQNDWFNFCDKVNGGDTFSDKYVKITCNDHWLPIVSEMAGTDETHSFQGVFDGNGHTITFNVTVTATEDYCAPFRHVKNAVIKNLRVNGQIYVSGKFTAGIVAASHGNLTITNCRSSVGIHSSRSGDCTHAGFVALLNGADNAITINNCVFDGEFTTTNGTTNCAGFIGWPVHNKPIIKNSIMMPEKVDAGMIEKTFARFPDGFEPTITDCYFVNTGDLPTNQGTQSGYATLPENAICKLITTTNPVVKTLYSVACTVSGVKDSYKLDGVPANITPSVTDPNGTALALGTDFTATLNGKAVASFPVAILTEGNYTLVLAAKGNYAGSKTFNFTATGALRGISEDDPIIINTEADWNAFANDVNSGTNSYNGQFVRLDANIEVTTPVGTEANPFRGTFLGNTKTITATITDTDNKGTALFRYINGATIKDLKVAGTITGGIHAAAIVGFAGGTGNSMTNCVAKANVSGGSHIGGLLGHGLSCDIAITGCVYDGTMTGGGTAKGAIFGWGDNGGNKSITDCLYIMQDGQNTDGLDLVKGYSSVTVTNCYKYTVAEYKAQNGQKARAVGNAAVRADNEPALSFSDTLEDDEDYDITDLEYYGIWANVYDNMPDYFGELLLDYGFLKVYEGGLEYEEEYYVASISLDDNADNSDLISLATEYIVDVTLTDRTLYKDGKWNTLCLPFNVTLSGSVLDGATARPLTAASISGSTLNLTFGDAVSTLVAGTPYIIKWASGANIENPVFCGVTIDETDRSYDNGASGKGRVRFVGTYKSTAFDGEDNSVLLMGGENKLYYPTTGAGIGAQHAYFKIGENGVMLTRQLTDFSIDFGENDETTGIISTTNYTNSTNSTGAWYSIDGRKLDGKPTRNGVYVNNGRKVVIK